MRTVINLLALALGAAAAFGQPPPIDLEQAPPVESMNPALELFFGPGQTYRLTVSSENGTVVTLDIPEGTMLGLSILSQEGNPPPKEALELPSTFSGRIWVRARRADEVGSMAGRSAREILAGGPVLVVVDAEAALLEEISTANAASVGQETTD